MVIRPGIEAAWVGDRRQSLTWRVGGVFVDTAWCKGEAVCTHTGSGAFMDFKFGVMFMTSSTRSGCNHKTVTVAWSTHRD